MTLAQLPALVLGPLQGRSDEEWEHGPPGKWTPAQIVEHLALGLNLSAATFLSRQSHAPMSRRRRTPAEHVARLFIFGLRWFPPGRNAPRPPRRSTAQRQKRIFWPVSRRGIKSTARCYRSDAPICS